MSKWAILSKTIIGILISLAGSFGLADAIPTGLAENIGSLIDNVMVVGGALLAIYGRVKADKPITILPAKKE